MNLNVSCLKLRDFFPLHSLYGNCSESTRYYWPGILQPPHCGNLARWFLTRFIIAAALAGPLQKVIIRVAPPGKSAPFLFIGAFHDKRLVAFSFLMIRNRNERLAEIGLGILDQYQGWGLGHRLMDGIVRRAQENGVEQVCLAVYQTNFKAIGLYRKHGFLIRERTDGMLKMGKYLRNPSAWVRK